MSSARATVLFDLTTLEAGSRLRGIGRYAAELARGLARRPPRDLRVLFVEELEWSGRIGLTEDADGAIQRLSRPDRPISGHTDWTRRVRVGIPLAARKANADLVHMPHTDATPLLKGGAARLVTCHDLIPLRFPDHYTSRHDGYRWGRHLRDGRRFRTADHILAISQATANDLHSILGVSPGKISVVHHGINHANWAPDPAPTDADHLAELGLSDTSFLLCVGAADWRKNHTRMFAALAQARHRGADVELVWAGHLPPSIHQWLTRDAARLGVSSAVHLVGYIDDAALKALYRAALATMFISLCEGFGYPVLEGMAIGCPVITSSQSSMGEIARHGAVVVHPERTDLIADAIVRLAQEPQWRREIRARGLARAAEFTRERQVEQTLAVYRHLLRR